jgi:hypothetical protein
MISWRCYINITVLDLIRRPLFHLLHDVSGTWLCFRFQGEQSQMDPTERVLLCLRGHRQGKRCSRPWNVMFKIRDRTMDKIRNCDRSLNHVFKCRLEAEVVLYSVLTPLSLFQADSDISKYTHNDVYLTRKWAINLDLYVMHRNKIWYLFMATEKCSELANRVFQFFIWLCVSEFTPEFDMMVGGFKNDYVCI